MTTPFIIGRQQVAMAIEAVEGTAQAISASDVIAPVYEVEYSPEFSMNERNAMKPSFSPLTKVSGEIKCSLKFSTEIKGSGVPGTPPPNLSVPFRACGMKEIISSGVSVRYTATDPENTPSVTIHILEGTVDNRVKVKKMIGARGTFSHEATKGGIIMAKFEFKGVYVEPSDSIDFFAQDSGIAPAAFLGANISLFGISGLRVRKVNFDLGNEIAFRNDANQPTGNLSAVIVRRKPKIETDPEQTETSEINLYNHLTSSTDGAVSFMVIAGSGKNVGFLSPHNNIENISEGDRDGIRIVELTLQGNESNVL